MATFGEGFTPRGVVVPFSSRPAGKLGPRVEADVSCLKASRMLLLARLRDT